MTLASSSCAHVHTLPFVIVVPRDAVLLMGTAHAKTKKKDSPALNSCAALVGYWPPHMVVDGIDSRHRSESLFWLSGRVPHLLLGLQTSCDVGSGAGVASRAIPGLAHDTKGSPVIFFRSLSTQRATVIAAAPSKVRQPPCAIYVYVEHRSRAGLAGAASFLCPIETPHTVMRTPREHCPMPCPSLRILRQ